MKFIWNNKKRPDVTTNAKFQPFFHFFASVTAGKEFENQWGRNDGEETTPRCLKETTIAVYIHHWHYCALWQGEGVKFMRAIEEIVRKLIKDNLVVSPENVIKVEKYDFRKKLKDY